MGYILSKYCIGGLGIHSVMLEDCGIIGLDQVGVCVIIELIHARRIDQRLLWLLDLQVVFWCFLHNGLPDRTVGHQVTCLCGTDLFCFLRLFVFMIAQLLCMNSSSCMTMKIFFQNFYVTIKENTYKIIIFSDAKFWERCVPKSHRVCMPKITAVS